MNTALQLRGPLGDGAVNILNTPLNPLVYAGFTFSPFTIKFLARFPVKVAEPKVEQPHISINEHQLEWAFPSTELMTKIRDPITLRTDLSRQYDKFELTVAPGLEVVVHSRSVSIRYVSPCRVSVSLNLSYLS